MATPAVKKTDTKKTRKKPRITEQGEREQKKQRRGAHGTFPWTKIEALVRHQQSVPMVLGNDGKTYHRRVTASRYMEFARHGGGVKRIKD